LLAKLVFYFKIVVVFDSNLYEIEVLLYEKPNHSLRFFVLNGWLGVGNVIVFVF
jgi:hypothetical protein